MNLTQYKVEGFINLLASEAPAPGGGSAAALCASLGVALSSMVALLTIGKKKYAQHQTLMEDILNQATNIKAKLVDSIEEDTAAFNKVSAVFSMAKDSDEEKQARKQAMEEALKAATLVPFHVMTLCLEALKITHQALGNSNTNAVSDLGVAALSLVAGIKGAWLNVLINLSGIKDESFVAKYKEEGKRLVAEAEALGRDEIYEKILMELI